MGQGVHAGGGGQALGHAAHHVGVDNGDFRDVVGVHADELALLLHVGDDVVDGDLRGGAGGGGHGDGEHGVLLGGGHALQGAHVLELGVVDDDADGLRGVHGRAAADGYDAVRAAFLEGRHAALHVFDGGVGLDVAVDLIGEAGLVQQVGDLLGHVELDQVGVGADEGLFIAAGGQLGHDVFDGAAAVIGNGVQNDTIGHGNALSFYYEWFGAVNAAVFILRQLLPIVKHEMRKGETDTHPCSLAEKEVISTLAVPPFRMTTNWRLSS